MASETHSREMEPPIRQCSRSSGANPLNSSNEYQSSSSEDELEINSVLDGIWSKYSNTISADGHLPEDVYSNRTSAIIQQAMQTRANTCLICISKIKRDNSVWSCSQCYCLFHLICIQRWSKDRVSDIPKWACPKCRHSYTPQQVPSEYYCFCGKTLQPKFQSLLAPHSCGELCSKLLQPNCGHRCLLLCHAGPCPACPVTISATCHCSRAAAQMVACSRKGWSCGRRCERRLACGKHICLTECHSNDCPPCRKKSLQKCQCGAEQILRDCAVPNWQCDKICSNMLNCGKHKCMVKCHAKDQCPPCKLLSGRRHCPCGKTSYQLSSCTADVPTCESVCGKLLECGRHTCYKTCHRDACGLCSELVEKSCRCGSSTKHVPCAKPYTCNKKCKRQKDCNRHPCNRKCCDGNCPPCEKRCDRTLNCRRHKCTGLCHVGACYPCNVTDRIQCRCGKTHFEIACGSRQRMRRITPKCPQLCRAPPDCHHLERSDHRCHFGACPPCPLVCNKPLPNCTHLCTKRCHSVVLVQMPTEKNGTMPWERTGSQLQRTPLTCPDCAIYVQVTCFGSHETHQVACHQSKPYSCGGECGRLLACGNHRCSRVCHQLRIGVNDEGDADENCETCEYPCSRTPVENCTHQCRLQCHSGDCPKCTETIRKQCHCTMFFLNILCCELTSAAHDPAALEEVYSCQLRCPKNYDCGHRCLSKCHSGPCPIPNECTAKEAFQCNCGRIQRKIPCNVLRSNKTQTHKSPKIECNSECRQQQEFKRHEQELYMRQVELLHQQRNQKELDKYEKLFMGNNHRSRKKYNKRTMHNTDNESYWYSASLYYTFFIVGIVCAVTSLLVIYFVWM